MTSPASLASDPIVFVSAFTSGAAGAIHAYQFDTASGKLRLLQRTTDIEHPFFLAISADNQFLYAIDADNFGGTENEFVAAYKIDGRSGGLTRINRSSSLGTAACYLDVDSTGQSVCVANYSTGSVAALPIQSDGSLGAAGAFVQHVGSSIDLQRQSSPHAHCIVISPDNRFALAADLGTDQVLIYRLTPATAQLTPNPAQPFVSLPPGSGPRHLTFHPNGRQVYVINELKNTVTCFDYTAEDGRLTAQQTIPTLPSDFTGTSHTADLKITPDGKFLYGTNRGHDSIAIFGIDADGQLSLVRIVPSLGKGPQNLLVTPDGRWLLCGNMPGNNLVVFAIDARSGELTPSGEAIELPMPACIRWLP